MFICGDSAGGNIAHNMVMATGKPELKLGLDIRGLAWCIRFSGVRILSGRNM